MAHKAGFVNIIGSPNVGKSTLMNALVGERISVVTSKAQTTRHRILGIVNGEDFQIVFSDTPGILDPAYLLQESMMKAVESALEDADLFILVLEMGEHFDHPEILEKLKQSGVPVIVAVNKIDLSEQQKVVSFMKDWENRIDKMKIVPVSALKGFNLESINQYILDYLPESPPFFDKDELTDRSERFFASEIIRGHILEQFKKEVPYSVEVVVESFTEEPGMLNIRSIIYVTRESQKVILIGEGGKAIKRLGTESRKDLEQFFDRHIFLDLQVKVSKNWREEKNQLKKFGYQV